MTKQEVQTTVQTSCFIIDDWTHLSSHFGQEPLVLSLVQKTDPRAQEATQLMLFAFQAASTVLPVLHKATERCPCDTNWTYLGHQS